MPQEGERLCYLEQIYGGPKQASPCLSLGGHLCINLQGTWNTEAQGGQWVTWTRQNTKDGVSVVSSPKAFLAGRKASKKATRCQEEICGIPGTKRRLLWLDRKKQGPDYKETSKSCKGCWSNSKASERDNGTLFLFFNQSTNPPCGCWNITTTWRWEPLCEEYSLCGFKILLIPNT